VKADLMEVSDVRCQLEKHHRSSFGWALNCCGRNRVEAEEVLQIVYLKILEGKAQYRGEASFKTWLFAVIRKTAANERRKSLLRRIIVDARKERMASSQVVDPVGELEHSETQARFRNALDQLPRRQRETLHLVLYEELSLREAAEVIGISIGAIRRHYARAKKRLRDLLVPKNNYEIEWRREKNPGAVS
jgi:RNA polymerase sigma-70 factor (ECF subfamily)